MAGLVHVNRSFKRWCWNHDIISILSRCTARTSNCMWLIHNRQELWYIPHTQLCIHNLVIHSWFMKIINSVWLKIFSKTALWAICIWWSYRLIKFCCGHISYIFQWYWKKQRSFNSHVGYEIVKIPYLGWILHSIGYWGLMSSTAMGSWWWGHCNFCRSHCKVYNQPDQHDVPVDKKIRFFYFFILGYHERSSEAIKGRWENIKKRGMYTYWILACLFCNEIFLW